MAALGLPVGTCALLGVHTRDTQWHWPAMALAGDTAAGAGCLQQDVAVPPGLCCVTHVYLSPVFTWCLVAAGTLPSSTRHSVSPGPLSPQHTLLPAAGTAWHSG